MPNFKLGSTVREHITARAKHLTNRRLDYAKGDFPLTTAGVQCALIEPHTLSLIHQLKGQGYLQTPEVTDTTVLLSCREFPLLLRSVALNMILPEAIHTPKPVHWHAYSDVLSNEPRNSNANTSSLLTFLELDDADRAAVTKWANGVVRELRLQEITIWAVKGVLENCQGSSHVLAAWPMLATLVSDPFWKNRFRQPTRKLTPYAPSTQLVEKFGKAMQAAEVVLTGAELLEDYKHPPGTIHASIGAWERLPRDIRYDRP